MRPVESFGETKLISRSGVASRNSSCGIGVRVVLAPEPDVLTRPWMHWCCSGEKQSDLPRPCGRDRMDLVRTCDHLARLARDVARTERRLLSREDIARRRVRA